jgi:hypothetical protein
MKYRLATLVAALSIAACSDATTKATPTGKPDSSAPIVTNDAAPPKTDAATPEAGVDAGDAGGTAPPDGPPLGQRDRAGRPFVAFLLVSPARREDYNAVSGAADPLEFGPDFQAGLVALDAMDGTSDWNGGLADAGPDDAGGFAHPLVASWLDDAILVDPNLPFSDSGYLDIEANGNAHLTCGGRWPGDDSLDRTMSFLVGKTLTGVTDGVSTPAKAPSLQFPYLAEPF